MMNDSNQISKETRLFGFIGEHAGASRFSAVINKAFKANGDDAMMIPMNIRADDLYFTISNMKESHVNGAVISNEYVTDVLDLLDDSNAMVKRSGMCDIIYKEGKTLRGDIFGVRVLTEHLKDMGVSKVAIIGPNHYSKAFSFLACGFNVSYFNENLEELMAFAKEVELQDADMNRIASGMSLDFSTFDVLLDFSDLDSLGAIEKFPAFSLDMKNTKQFSALKQRSLELGAKYVSYDDLVDKLTAQAYLAIKKAKR
jgi:shikimate 5-dehydrogenase